MAVRKPLVQIAGQVTQLPEGDSVSTGLVNIGEQVVVTAAVTVLVEPSNVKFEHLGGGTQNVDTINGGLDGDILYVRLFPGSNNVRVRKGMGNIFGGSNRLLNSTTQLLVLLNNNGISWTEMSWSS